MIYNIWISASQPMKQDLKRLATGNYTRDPGPEPPDYPPTEPPWPPPERANDNPLTHPELYDWDAATIELFAGFLESDITENFLEEWAAAGRVYKVWSTYSDKPIGLVQTIRADIDMLAAAYPQDFAIMGAWDWDGDQVGNPPWYPIPNQLINFMPNGVLEDVHLLVGQGPRDFTQ